MMTPYMTSRLGLPTENLMFSLPICVYFFVNIPVYRLDYKFAAKRFGTLMKRKTWA